MMNGMFSKLGNPWEYRPAWLLSLPLSSKSMIINSAKSKLKTSALSLNGKPSRISGLLQTPGRPRLQKNRDIGILFQLAKSAALCGIVLGLGGCAAPATVHYRITVNVDDHGVMREGSAIWTVRLSSSSGLDASYSGGFQGDAIPVQLSSGGTIFVLPMGYRVTYSVAEMLPERLFKPLGGTTDRVVQLREISRHVGASRTTRCNYSAVDTERFAADPRGPNADCLAVAFLRKHGGEHDLISVPLGKLTGIAGSGVTIQGVYVTITNEAGKSNIQEIVPWINKIPDARHAYSTDFPKQYNVAEEAFFLRR